MRFSKPELEFACNAIGNQLAAGIAFDLTVRRMAKLQPKYEAFWAEHGEAMARGDRFSNRVGDVWPEWLVAAIKAGEESGKLADVFSRTAKTIQTQLQVKKLYSKLVSPVVAFLAGVGVMLFYMVVVIPQLAGTLGGGEQSLTLRASLAMKYVVDNYGLGLIAGLIALVFGGVAWFKRPENVDKVITLATRVPILKTAMLNLYFAMWAEQLALLAAAGNITMKNQLLLSVKMLPSVYQSGVVAAAQDIEKRGYADAVDPDMQAEDDPRRAWPYYISTSFMVAYETGELDVQLLRSAPILLDEGIRALTKFITIADFVAKICAATMIAIPLMAYFSQMANSMAHAFG